ncbi:MAG: copper chaperone PCu(A)C [Chloroflexota bacterium]
MKRTFALFFALALTLSACGSPKQGIEVRDVWARSSTQGMNGAVYFVIENHNSQADELIGAASDIAEVVEIHESKMEGDVMMMNQVEAVALEPSAVVEFKPGGYHVMLIRLTRDLKAGDEIEVTLHFKNSPDLTIKAMVKDADGMQNMGGHSP